MATSSADKAVGPPAPDVRAMELDGDISLYDPASGNAVVLNATASDVWRLADGELTVEEIAGLLAKAYQVAPESIRADVERVVGELTEHGFLAG